MNLVVDASVVVKWVLPEDGLEEDQDRALAVLAAIGTGAASVLQPPHWLAEVAAVVTRLRPGIAEQAIEILDLMELPITLDVTVMKRAACLGRDLNHHVFDTLYHAVALEYGSLLVTADETYARKAQRLGGLLPLKDWSTQP